MVFDSQNSNQQLTFQEIESRESQLTSKSDQDSQIHQVNYKINKRVYDVHQGEPYFKLIKFSDLVQMNNYSRRENEQVLASGQIDYDLIMANELIGQQEQADQDHNENGNYLELMD